MTLGQPDLVPTANETAPHFPGGLESPGATAQVPQSSQVQPSGGFSVELLFEADAVNPGGAGDGCIDLVSDNWSVQITPSNTLKLWLPTSGGNLHAEGTTSLVPTQVYQVVATYDGTTASLYVKGDWLRIGTTQNNADPAVSAAVRAGEATFFSEMKSLWDGTGTFVGNFDGNNPSAPDSSLVGVMGSENFEGAIGYSWSPETWGGAAFLQTAYQHQYSTVASPSYLTFSTEFNLDGCGSSAA